MRPLKRFNKALNGENGIEILFGQCGIVVAVDDGRVFELNPFRDFPKRRVAVYCFRFKGRMAAFDIKPSAGNQSEGFFRKAHLKGGPGRLY